MAKYQSEKLLDDLAADVRQILLQLDELSSHSDEALRQKPDEKAWSAVEVVAHLNHYAKFYVNAIEEQLAGHQTQSQTSFQAGWLGNYFTKLMGPSPDDQVKNKMTAKKEAQPQAPANLHPKTEIQELIQHQHQLLNLLQIARTADLGRIRVPTSLKRLIKIKLGDAFRFVIAHEQRHFQQIHRIQMV
jgi:uncharacterized damage-inducible protein DinB